MVSTTLMIYGLTTGVKVSLKSRPDILVNPFATSLPLYLEILPSGFLLIMKSHLQPTKLVYGGLGTKVHVPFCIKASNSSEQALLRWGILRACEMVGGSKFSGRMCLEVVNTFGLKILFWDLVTIEWVRVWLFEVEGKEVVEVELLPNCSLREEDKFWEAVAAGTTLGVVFVGLLAVGVVVICVDSIGIMVWIERSAGGMCWGDFGDWINVW